MKRSFLVVLGILLAGCSSTKTTSLGDCVFEVEEARSQAELTQGLSGRESLVKNRGMLFFMPYEIQKGSETGPSGKIK